MFQSGDELMITAAQAMGKRVYLGNWLTAYRHGDRYGDVIAVHDNSVLVRFPDGRKRWFPIGDVNEQP
jgi:hypothetical protein